MGYVLESWLNVHPPAPRLLVLGKKQAKLLQRLCCGVTALRCYHRHPLASAFGRCVKSTRVVERSLSRRLPSCGATLCVSFGARCYYGATMVRRVCNVQVGRSGGLLCSNSRIGDSPFFPLRLSVFAVSPSHHLTVSSSSSHVPCPLRNPSPAHCASRCGIREKTLVGLRTRTHCIGYPHTHTAILPLVLTRGWVPVTLPSPTLPASGQHSHRSSHIYQPPASCEHDIVIGI